MSHHVCLVLAGTLFMSELSNHLGNYLLMKVENDPSLRDTGVSFLTSEWCTATIMSWPRVSTPNKERNLLELRKDRSDMTYGRFTAGQGRNTMEQL
jgi:hypothetical protein